MARLSRDFYAQNTVCAAQQLLGKILVRVWDGTILAGRITETEAYIGRCDKACHAYNYRRTTRTDALFQPPGFAYIYLIYGLHHCLNLVTEQEGEPAAVLIRSLEAVAGEEEMIRLRYGEGSCLPARRRNLLNGPGKVCQALHLTLTENRADLTGSSLFVCESPEDIGLMPLSLPREEVCAGPRIGVDYAEEARWFPWRFYLRREE